MLTLTIRGHDLSNVHSFQELAQKTRQQHIRNVQLALNRSFPELDSSAKAMNPGFARMVKQTLGDEGVAVAILSCYINMIHPDLTIREELLQKFETYLQYARDFGAMMVASETGNVHSKMGYTEDNFTDEAFDTLVTVIKRLVQAGEKYQTMVAIEPGLNHPLYSLERVEQLLQSIDSDYLGIILDPTNLITAETYHNQVALVEEAFEKFGHKIVAVHLKDFTIDSGKVLPVPVGKGIINYKEIKKIIEKYRPYSVVVLEETTDDAIGQAVRLLEES